jgi:hypothetical protein
MSGKDHDHRDKNAHDHTIMLRRLGPRAGPAIGPSSLRKDWSIRGLDALVIP